LKWRSFRRGGRGPLQRPLQMMTRAQPRGGSARLGCLKAMDVAGGTL